MAADTRTTWKGVFWTFLSCRPQLLTALWVVALGAALADVAMPWFLQQGVDAALGTENGWSLNQVAWAMLMLAVVVGFTHWLAIVIETYLFSQGAFLLRQRLYSHLFQQRRGFFQRHRTGELVHRVANDIQMLETCLLALFSEMPFSLLVGLGVLVMMVLTNLKLTIVVLVFLLCAAWLTERTGRRMPSLRRLIQLRSARLASRLQESVAGMRTVQAFRAEGREARLLDEHNERIRIAEQCHGVQRSITTPLWDIAELAILIAVLWYAGSLVASNEITVGTFVAFIAYADLLSDPISSMGGYFYEYQTSRGIAQRIASLLNDHDSVPAGGEAGPAHAGQLVFDHVTFAYPATQRTVLDDISFTVEPGECVAIVGRNGAGKTTLLDLVLRFQQPQSGRITAGSLDLANWQIADWRGRVGLMPQDVVLFQGTVAENVAFGLDAIDEEAVKQALIQVAGYPFLHGLPAGLETDVGERGAALSGGQRQVVALARLFLHEPQIVLLDEPTANLDGDLLNHVGKALTEFLTGRTTLLVSHRPETIRLASRMVVVDNGRLVAEGTHDQLFRENEVYRQLIGSGEPTSIH